MSKSLTVICPVYNEAAGIRTFTERLQQTLRTLGDGYHWQILFVVDKCEDESLEIIRSLATNDPTICALALSSRFGHQVSLVAGMDHCDSDFAIMMDSDLQHPPELIPRLVEQFEKGYDIVHTIRKDSGVTPLIRRLFSRLYYRLINHFSEVPIQPGAADFRLISRRILKLFKSSMHERHQFLRGLFAWVGFPHTTLTYNANPRHAGTTKYKSRHLIQLAFEGLTAFSRAPLRWSIYSGFVLALCGLFFILYVLVKYMIVPEYFPKGWATVAVLILVFGGGQLFFLGILGEYIGAIFEEVKQRPRYIIEEQINLDGEA